MAREPFDIATKTGRGRLIPRRDPYYVRIQSGLYVGFRKLPQGEGTWTARRRNESGIQEYISFGPEVAGYDEAVRAALAWARRNDAGVTTKKVTVTDACEHYAEHLGLHKSKASKADAEGRFKRLVYDKPFGKIEMSRLRTTHVQTWLADLIGENEEDAEDEDELRRAKDSANRNFATLKAALNRAYYDHLVATDAGWKTVHKFKDVGRRREIFLTRDQRTALIAACPADLRPFATGLLHTAARPGELAKACVKHFDRRHGMLELDGKTGRRIVTLSTDAKKFFEKQSLNKLPDAPVFMTESGQPWNKDSWKKIFKLAVQAAGLPPAVVMYSLRHTTISELIIGGISTMEVARMAGTSMEMIDKYYGHLHHDQMRQRLDAVAVV